MEHDNLNDELNQALAVRGLDVELDDCAGCRHAHQVVAELRRELVAAVKQSAADAGELARIRRLLEWATR